MIDRIHAKRAAVALAALGAGAMAWWPTLPVIIAAQAVIGASSAIFAPAVSAISLGLVGHGRLPRRMGRNEAFNHAGNVVAALLAGWVGDHVAKMGVIYLVAAMSAATVATTLLIRWGDIDYALARGAVPDESNGASFRVAGISAPLRDRRITAFILAVSLFHFVNEAMLPLISQKLTDPQLFAGKRLRVTTHGMQKTALRATPPRTGSWSWRWTMYPS